MNKEVKIDNFVRITGATVKTAKAYLESEEWSVIDAVASYKADLNAGVIK